jgi:hypothetical protein
MELNPKPQLENIIKFCAENLRCFTSDHINLLCLWDEVPIGNRDVSSALLSAKKKKIIKRSDRARISDQNNNNSIPRVIWRSLIVKGKAVESV